MLTSEPLLASILALVVGVLILIFPRLLNFAVAAYLIVIGVIGLLGHYGYLGG
ncbi:MAG: DUF3096 domain-containing protein [Pseudomonadota bacterium]